MGGVGGGRRPSGSAEQTRIYILAHLTDALIPRSHHPLKIKMPSARATKSRKSTGTQSTLKFHATKQAVVTAAKASKVKEVVSRSTSQASTPKSSPEVVKIPRVNDL